MRIFVAGSTGAIGRQLVPLLLESGHAVVALCRDTAKARWLEAIGAAPLLADPFDRDGLTAAIVATRPEIVIHELTALSRMSSFRKLDEEFALTNRFRTEVTDTLIRAARLAGARRFIAQSYCGWPFARVGGPVKTEEDPLDDHPPSTFRRTFEAIRHLETAVREASDIHAVALRYGAFYGPGTGISRTGPIAQLIRKRQFPIVGEGSGIWSFLHIEDAALATVTAISHGSPGIYNIVDDEPAPVSAWLPHLAQALGARPPRRIPAWLGRLAIGQGGVMVMTQARGGSNAKARRELGWRPSHPSWRQGFVEGLG